VIEICGIECPDLFDLAIKIALRSTERPQHRASCINARSPIRSRGARLRIHAMSDDSRQRALIKSAYRDL